MAALEAAVFDHFADGGQSIVTEWVLVAAVVPVEGGRPAEVAYRVRAPQHMLHHHTVGLLNEGLEWAEYREDDDD